MSVAVGAEEEEEEEEDENEDENVDADVDVNADVDEDMDVGGDEDEEADMIRMLKAEMRLEVRVTPAMASVVTVSRSEAPCKPIQRQRPPRQIDNSRNARRRDPLVDLLHPTRNRRRCRRWPCRRTDSRCGLLYHRHHHGHRPVATARQSSRATGVFRTQPSTSTNPNTARRCSTDDLGSTLLAEARVRNSRTTTTPPGISSGTNTSASISSSPSNRTLPRRTPTTSSTASVRTNMPFLTDTQETRHRIINTQLQCVGTRSRPPGTWDRCGFTRVQAWLRIRGLRSRAGNGAALHHHRHHDSLLVLHNESTSRIRATSYHG